jgi:hypothetical protein
LYIRPSRFFEDVFAKKIAFLVTLKQVIGEQKVDILIEPSVPDGFRQEVIRSGLLLCKSGLNACFLNVINMSYA